MNHDTRSPRAVALLLLASCLVAIAILLVDSKPLGLPFVAIAVLCLAFVWRQPEPAPVVAVENNDAVEPPTIAHFVARADEALKAGEGNPAVLVVALDGFRDVQTVLGDTRVEEVLRIVAGRIEEVAGEWPMAALGGERFAVAMRARPFLPAHHIGRRLRERIAEPMEVDGVSLRLRSSVGVALGEGGAELLTTRATIASGHAQESHEGLLVHNPEEPDVVRRRLAIVTGLSDALANPKEHGFRPMFQPIVDQHGALVSAEALARWDDPVLGTMTPDTFIPLAEHTGLVAPLFSLMLHQSLLECRRWRDGGVEASLSINVSPVNLRDPLLISELTAKLEELRLEPSDVTLEITESTLFDDVGGAIVTLRELRRLGFGIALDDFGIGYSSLARLHDLPVTIVKLDKSFIDGLPQDTRSIGIARSTVEVCQLLGLTVVAEGVERNEQADVLIEMGVHRMQGFLFSPAITVEEIVSGPIVPSEALEDRR